MGKLSIPLEIEFVEEHGDKTISAWTMPASFSFHHDEDLNLQIEELERKLQLFHEKRNGTKCLVEIALSDSFYSNDVYEEENDDNKQGNGSNS